MILKNPLNEELSLNYKGDHYVLPALGTLKVPDQVGAYWKTRIHEFLQVSDDPQAVSIPTPKVVEEVPAEVVVETSVAEAAPAPDLKVKKGKK